MTLADEFDTLISTLEQAGLEYAVVGALAVAIWGAPRATKDIDLLVQQRDLPALITTVGELGFTFAAAPMSFSDGMSVQRVSKVSGADVLTLAFLIVNPNLESAWSSRQRVTTARGEVWTLTRDALIDMKLRAARPQDLFDVQRMKDLDR